MPREHWPPHLCLNKGYDSVDGWDACIDHDYERRIAQIRDERPSRPKPHRPRRWVEDRTLAWLSKRRAIVIRWDTKT